MMKLVLCSAALVQLAFGLGFVNTNLLPGVNPFVANINPTLNTNFLAASTASGSTVRPQTFRDRRNPFIYTQTIDPFPGWVLIDTEDTSDVYGETRFLSITEFGEIVGSTIEPGVVGSQDIRSGRIVWDSEGLIQNVPVLFLYSNVTADGSINRLCKRISLNYQIQFVCNQSAILGVFVAPGEQADFANGRLGLQGNVNTHTKTWDTQSRNTAFEPLDFANVGKTRLAGDTWFAQSTQVPTSPFPYTNLGVHPCCDFQ